MNAADPDRQLLELHDRFCAGFAERDAEALLRTVADRADLAVVTSENPVLRGPDEFRVFVERYISGGTAYSWVWESRQVAICGEVGWLLALGTETAATDTDAHETRYRMTLVAERASGAWRLVQVHGSSPHDL